MRKTKLLALLLAVAMIASMIIPNAAAVTAGACPEHTSVSDWTEIAEGTWTGGELADGHYVLTGNQAITSALTVAGYVCIDLAGYSITAGAKAEGGSKAGYRVFEIAAGATLVICDSAEEDGVISGGRVRASAEDLTAAGRCAGGNIYVEGTFTLYDGVIADGVASSGSVNYNNYGGNIYGAAGSVINVKGGMIKDGALNKGQLCYGTSKSGGGWGGNIYTAGTLNISGDAVISGGRYTGYNDPIANKSTATNRLANKVYGGNIALVSGAVMTMSGGTITEGSLVNNLSTATTTPNKVHAFGGNIYANGAKITITGGTISNGRVEAGAFTSAEGGFNITEDSKHDIAARGGNIYITFGTELTIKNATVSGGVAEQSADGNAGFSKETGLQTTSYGTSQGGNIYVSGGTVNLEKATISDGQSDYRGGNVAVGTGTLNITNTKFQNGTLKNEFNRTVTGEIGELYTLGTACRGADIYASGDIEINIRGSETKFTGANGGEYTTGQSINTRGNTVVNIYDGDLSDQSSCFDGNKVATMTGGRLRNDDLQLGGKLSMADKKVAVLSGTVYAPYDKLSYAFAAAAINNAEVLLLDDYQGDSVNVPLNVTLDLFGHTLTVNTFTCAFEGCNIIDSKGTGKLICEDVAITETNKQLPIKYEGAYYFESPAIAEKLDGNVYKFYLADAMEKTLLDEVLANGTANTGIAMEVYVTWKEGDVAKAKTFDVSSDLVAQFVADWENKMFVLTITSDLTNITDLTCTARLVQA